MEEDTRRDCCLETGETKKQRQESRLTGVRLTGQDPGDQRQAGKGEL